MTFKSLNRAFCGARPEEILLMTNSWLSLVTNVLGFRSPVAVVAATRRLRRKRKLAMSMFAMLLLLLPTVVWLSSQSETRPFLPPRVFLLLLRYAVPAAVLETWRWIRRSECQAPSSLISSDVLDTSLPNRGKNGSERETHRDGRAAEDATSSDSRRRDETGGAEVVDALHTSD